MDWFVINPCDGEIEFQCLFANVVLGAVGYFALRLKGS